MEKIEHQTEVSVAGETMCVPRETNRNEKMSPNQINHVLREVDKVL